LLLPRDEEFAICTHDSEAFAMTNLLLKERNHDREQACAGWVKCVLNMVRLPLQHMYARVRSFDPQCDRDESLKGVITSDGCGQLYQQFEKCLGDNNRQWELCQDHMRRFRECFEAGKNAQTRSASEMDPTGSPFKKSTQ